MKKIEFNKYRNLCLYTSLILALLSIAIAVFRGFNFSIDFTGGIAMEFTQNGKEVTAEKVRDILKEAKIQDFTVQQTKEGKTIIVKVGTKNSSKESYFSITQNIQSVILNSFTKTDIEFLKVDFVSPQIGKELITKAIIAVLSSLMAVLIYIGIRFEIRYSFGAILALLHDVALTVGFISLLDLPFDVSIIAAILTVIGYSINDSVVIFDRIRENFRLKTKEAPGVIIEMSLNATLSRTIITSFTTLIALLAIILLGGEILRPFAMIIFFGVSVGTLSSVFIAPLFLYNRSSV